MSKLTFVGLGLGDRGVSIAGVRAIAEAEVVYLEYYTSPHAPSLIGELERAAGRSITVVDRAFVEDGKKILSDANKMSVVLAVQGDPMIATTHNDLRVRAITQGVETVVIHGATIPNAAASASGLHYYKFGATVTFTREALKYHQQVYKRVHRNLLEGLHTLLLLEYDTEQGAGAEPSSLMEALVEAERNFKRNVITDRTFIIVLSRVGSEGEGIAAGALGEMKRREFGEPPHCVIIPGSLHFTEIEAVAAICALSQSSVTDNASQIKRTAHVLLPRYAEKAKKALEQARSSLGAEYDNLLENAELYLRDSEDFLTNEEDELAMLSIGYAEGLIDSLSFTGKLKLDW